MRKGNLLKEKERQMEEKIKKFFQDRDKEWIKYDFREEIVEFPSTNACERHAIYQAIGIGEKNKDKEKLGFAEAYNIYKEYKTKIRVVGGEADSCLLVQELYKVLWKDKDLRACRETDGTLTCDTMNSINYTLNELFKSERGEEVFGEKNKWGKVTTVYLYAKEPDKYEKSILSYTGAEDFLATAYTIGNLMPVPIGCNGARGFGKTKDYWDLTLNDIYNWYIHDEDNSFLEELLSGAKADKGHPETKEKNLQEVVERYANWLRELSKDEGGKEQKGQKGWNNFVKNTFMDPFVEKDGTDFGKPRELWDGHFAGNVLPEYEWQFEQFFVNARVRILERGKLIAEKLAEQFRAENNSK